jgi:exonuclease III
LDKTFFNLKHDIFICTVYIPPQNSSSESQINIDHFENLQNDISKFASKGNIILCGDFNARIGVVEDLIDNKFLKDDKYTTLSLDQ